VTPFDATRCPHQSGEGRGLLAVEVTFKPVTYASCSMTPGQPGPSTTSISPAGAGIRFEIDQRLTYRRRRSRPCQAWSRETREALAPPIAVAAGFLALAVADDDLKR
jgi:hypothetical protein